MDWLTETGLQMAMPYILVILGFVVLLIVMGLALLVLSGLSGMLKRLGGRFERFEYRVRVMWSGPRHTREALRIADIHEWERLTSGRHPARDDGELAELERIVALGEHRSSRRASKPSR
jgi:hypothetical protein